jgi:hypothetical protein
MCITIKYEFKCEKKIYKRDNFFVFLLHFLLSFEREREREIREGMNKENVIIV